MFCYLRTDFAIIASSVIRLVKTLYKKTPFQKVDDW